MSENNNLGTVYLLCFSRKLHHAKHYLGFAPKSLKSRVLKHKNGRGSKLTQAVKKQGIKIRLVRVWQDRDRNYERYLKLKKNSKLLCPICNKKMPKFFKNFMLQRARQVYYG